MAMNKRFTYTDVYTYVARQTSMADAHELLLHNDPAVVKQVITLAQSYVDQHRKETSSRHHLSQPSVADSIHALEAFIKADIETRKIRVSANFDLNGYIRQVAGAIANETKAVVSAHIYELTHQRFMTQKEIDASLARQPARSSAQPKKASELSPSDTIATARTLESLSQILGPVTGLGQ
jgi:hypothetical protein